MTDDDLPSPPDLPDLPDLLDRLSRVLAAEDWSGDLNPAQRAALSYLVRANRFSRSPSHVADYLCTTRGTASQTLKALEMKGLIARADGAGDRRSVSFRVTEAGDAAARGGADPSEPTLPPADQAALQRLLQDLLTETLARRGWRSFGLCKTCRHHDRDAGYCTLLQVPLTPTDANQICHEHEAA